MLALTFFNLFLIHYTQSSLLMFTYMKWYTQLITLICTYAAKNMYFKSTKLVHLHWYLFPFCFSLNYLTLRNMHFSDDCAMIASYSSQVYCLFKIPLYSVSPSAMSWFLCITPISFEKHLLSHQLSLLYGGAERENTCLWLHVTTSCVFQSLPVTPHCFPLLRSQQYFWEHLCINFLLDYRSHAKDNLAWCGFKAGISLWGCSPLPALICSTLYSPMPDGRLKSIILPTEICFPEHYIKPQSSVQGVW